MGMEDLYHTGLVLGLGVSSMGEGNSPSTEAHRMEPSLTLTLSHQTLDQNIHPVKMVGFDHKNSHINIHQSGELYGQDSGVSSLSNVSVKREREIGSEEVERERVSSRVSDEDDDGSNGRKKLRLTKPQSALLEESFKKNSTLNPKRKQELARELKLRPRQVEVWFQNRRARTKLKQTEVDCEVLKKCCETLSEENRRLQKELRELKSLKLGEPLYMQLPAATLTVCPSCERIGAAGSDNAAKRYFYNPFANQSAAC